MRKITISHRRKNCIGCGSCVSLATDVWFLDDDDGQARLRKCQKKGDVDIVQIDREDFRKVQKAAGACPMKIIQVHGDNH